MIIVEGITMLGMKRVALFAAAAVAGGMLSFSAVPAGAQALRLGLADHTAFAGQIETVAWRGGPAFRGGGGMRGVGAPRMGGARFVGGPRFAARPGFVGRPGYVGRPGFVGRPGYVGRPIAGPGWNRPGIGPRPPVWAGRPGWGPGWGHPGWRPPPGAWGPGAWRPGWGWWRPGWGWGYYNNTGAWIALGVASAVAVGAAAAAADTGYDDSVAYCMQRFRSYNPATGTYTGYDGLQHPCP